VEPAVTAPRDIWTRLVIDPLADPLARRLAPRPWVTPNRVTVVSGVLGVAAALCLATGRLRLGGALFLLRFFADCLDGKVARLQGSSSDRGALLDVATDTVCVAAAYAGLALWTVRHELLGVVPALALLAALACYDWALAHRKHRAGRPGLGDGGSTLFRRTGVPLLDPWLRACRRLGMRPVPWSVEAETLALGLLPLLGARAAAAGIVVALVFYVAAAAINLRRTWRIATVLDGSRAVPAGAEP